MRAATVVSGGRRQAIAAITRLRRAVPRQSQTQPWWYIHSPTPGETAVASIVDMPQ